MSKLREKFDKETNYKIDFSADDLSKERIKYLKAFSEWLEKHHTETVNKIFEDIEKVIKRRPCSVCSSGGNILYKTLFNLKLTYRNTDRKEDVNDL